MKIIVIDASATFRDELRTRLLIDDNRSVELLTDLSSADEISNVYDRFHPDAILMSDEAFETIQNRDLSLFPIVGYTTSPAAQNVFEGRNFPTYGYVESATHLLNLLEMGLPTQTEHSATETRAVVEEPVTVAPPTNPTSAPPPPPIVEEKVPLTAEQPVAASEQEPVGSVRSRLEAARAERSAREANSALRRDLEAAERKKTVTVAVYAAKGGVGKTTISAELACCLAMTNHGRNNFRVCVLDYNIDFGNILTVLDYEPEGKNLSYWAAEVRDRLRAGEKKEDIVYSRAEIEHYLQRLDKIGLYALIAPITHEDSMDIESTELEIILRNIIDNGEFDFVVLDTGNNTRDSSVIALEAADHVLLVATQDVSTADCNDAFLTTMKKIGFDTGKIRLVVNNIIPYRYTQVSVEEVEAMFPYNCIARIRRNNDVIRANNRCEPLVLQPDHEFSAEICKIVAFLTGKERVFKKEKPGFSFKNLFKRRNKEG